MIAAIKRNNEFSILRAWLSNFSVGLVLLGFAVFLFTISTRFPK